MMNPSSVYQLIGYAGSVLVVLSHTMRSVRNLRLINLGGAICFVWIFSRAKGFGESTASRATKNMPAIWSAWGLSRPAGSMSVFIA